MFEFEASLVYVQDSRATQRNPLSENQEKKKERKVGWVSWFMVYHLLLKLDSMNLILSIHMVDRTISHNLSSDWCIYIIKKENKCCCLGLYTKLSEYLGVDVCK